MSLDQEQRRTPGGSLLRSEIAKLQDSAAKSKKNIFAVVLDRRGVNVGTVLVENFGDKGVVTVSMSASKHFTGTRPIEARLEVQASW